MRETVIDKASHSEVESYLMCPRKHYYSYVQRIQPIRTTDPLARGNVGHEVLSCYYSMRKEGLSHDDAGMAAMDYLPVAANQYDVYDPDKLWDELYWLLLNYFEKYRDDEFRVIETEILHEVNVTGDYIMPIKVDLVLEIPGKGIVVRDWKFTNDFYTVDKIDMSPQLPKYFAVLMELGIKANVLEYDQLRYRNTKDNKANPFERYMRTPVPVTADRVTRTMHEQFLVAKKVAGIHQLSIEEAESIAVRNTMACNLCPFKDICDSDLNGGYDSPLITESFYEKRVRPSDTVPGNARSV